MIDPAPPSRPLRSVALTCGSLTIALGLLTIIGWSAGLPLLASVRAKYIPMAPSEAFCFSLLGIGLIDHLRRGHAIWLPRILAEAVLILVCSKLAELLAGWHFSIDAWFIRNPGMFGAVPTGRMSPITALNFVFLTLGLFTLTSTPTRRHASVFGALAIVISAVVLIGYWYGTPLLYGGTIIPVALSSASAFVFCGVAIVAAAGAEVWPLRAFLGSSTRALLLRAFVPLIIAAALLNGWLSTSLLRHFRANPAVIAALCAIIFGALIIWIITHVSGIVGGRIDRAEEARNFAQAQLVALNAQLEERVEERTRQLRDKNQQMEEELQMARELQLALLPQKFPTVPANVSTQESALRFLSLYFPTGNVGGDFFSVFPLGEKAVGVFICDVMGHGVRSALITSMIRAMVEEHAKATSDPGELLTRVNHALSFILKQADTTIFATCFYVVADLEKTEFRFSNAGHPVALHVRNGSAEKLEGDIRTGPAMGIFPEASYATSTRSMAAGDLIMLFTDGLFEVEDAAGNFFSQEQLQAAASRHASVAPQEFFNRVLDEVRQFSNRQTFDDDVCVVGVQVQHTG
jgi:serine phosphatase RsbU (regulator of sigma subunit)